MQLSQKQTLERSDRSIIGLAFTDGFRPFRDKNIDDSLPPQAFSCCQQPFGSNLYGTGQVTGVAICCRDPHANTVHPSSHPSPMSPVFGATPSTHPSCTLLLLILNAWTNSSLHFDTRVVFYPKCLPAVEVWKHTPFTGFMACFNLSWLVFGSRSVLPSPLFFTALTALTV